jgi:large subunit ribosomal protein L9
VKAGFGRNYLLPQGKAMLATAGRVKQVEHQRRVIDELQKKAIAGFQDLARRVLAVDMTFEMQASPEWKLFGSVTNADIAARLAAGGVEIERRKIVIAEPIKSVGEHLAVGPRECRHRSW